MAPITKFGPNPNSSRNPNSANGWSPDYKWPGGVPASRLGTLRFAGVKGQITIVARKELLPLIGTLMSITELRGYYFVPGWCWSYANRAITGTSIASNHSKGKAVDFNAPVNPYKTVATLTTDMPVWMVQLWEAHGFYWGGRYGDAMHYEFVYPPGSISKYFRSAAALLDVLEDPLAGYSKKEIQAIVEAGVRKVLPALIKAELQGYTQVDLTKGVASAGRVTQLAGLVRRGGTPGPHLQQIVDLLEDLHRDVSANTDSIDEIRKGLGR